MGIVHHFVSFPKKSAAGTLYTSPGQKLRFFKKLEAQG
jgi:hypothetical protein